MTSPRGGDGPRGCAERAGTAGGTPSRRTRARPQAPDNGVTTDALPDCRSNGPRRPRMAQPSTSSDTEDHPRLTGGLEVPSSNLGAPIEKPPQKGGFFVVSSDGARLAGA